MEYLRGLLRLAFTDLSLMLLFRKTLNNLPGRNEIARSRVVSWREAFFFYHKFLYLRRNTTGQGSLGTDMSSLVQSSMLVIEPLCLNSMKKSSGDKSSY